MQKQTPKVLVLSYAFPPLQVQVAPVVARLVAGLKSFGFNVHLICSDGSGPAGLPTDTSLLDYVESNCSRIQRIPFPYIKSKINKLLLRRLSDLPDCMNVLTSKMVKAVLGSAPMTYSGVITVSPFNSINRVMVRVKHVHPSLKWIAYFCDPWVGNPLENRWAARLVNAWMEPKTARKASYICHSSPHALDNIIQSYKFLSPDQLRVVPHFYDPSLYPARPKERNEKLVLRYLGTLFEKRTPENLFKGVKKMLDRRPDLEDLIQVELVGFVENGMMSSPAFKALPEGLVKHYQSVPYLESLRLMYDASVLLIIESASANAPFVPSKLTDYLGAGTPILGIVPDGECRRVLVATGCPVAKPDSIDEIANRLEEMIDTVRSGNPESSWEKKEFRQPYEVTNVVSVFASLLQE